MKILTVKQPWAWLIVAGPKDIENRTWATIYRGPVLIQASAKRPPRYEWDGAVAYARERGVEIPDALDFGGIVGIATVEECVRSHDSPWFMGPVGWVLSNRRALNFLRISGQMGLFDASKEVLRHFKLQEDFQPRIVP